MSQLKRERTKEDFLKFCTFILAHENYPPGETAPVTRADSTGSGEDTRSIKSEGSSSSSGVDMKAPLTSSSDSSDSDDYNDDGKVTCYCNKPYANRPMIQCDYCETWIHMSCAKVKKSNIPDVFACITCKAKLDGGVNLTLAVDGSKMSTSAVRSVHRNTLQSPL